METGSSAGAMRRFTSDRTAELTVLLGCVALGLGGCASITGMDGQQANSFPASSAPLSVRAAEALENTDF